MARHANHYMHQHSERITEQNIICWPERHAEKFKSNERDEKQPNTFSQSGKNLIWHTYATNYSTFLFGLFSNESSDTKMPNLRASFEKKRIFFISSFF